MSTSDVLAYVYENVGNENIVNPLGVEYLYENVSSVEVPLAVTPDFRGKEHLYEFIIPEWAWYGTFPYLDTITSWSDDASGGIIRTTAVDKGCGFLYGPMDISVGQQVQSVNFEAHIYSDTANGDGLQFKLEDVGATVNGEVFSLVHDSTYGGTGTYYVIPSYGFPANTWYVWIDEVTLTGPETIALTTALSTGQVALTCSPGGSGIRKVSWVQMRVKIGWEI